MSDTKDIIEQYRKASTNEEKSNIVTNLPPFEVYELIKATNDDGLILTLVRPDMLQEFARVRAFEMKEILEKNETDVKRKSEIEEHEKLQDEKREHEMRMACINNQKKLGQKRLKGPIVCLREDIAEDYDLINRMKSQNDPRFDDSIGIVEARVKIKEIKLKELEDDTEPQIVNLEGQE